MERRKILERKKESSRTRKIMKWLRARIPSSCSLTVAIPIGGARFFHPSWAEREPPGEPSVRRCGVKSGGV
ncbi:hypothetical protein BJX62DRAFT_197780 [Aspergillus germanicus]